MLSPFVFNRQKPFYLVLRFAFNQNSIDSDLLRIRSGKDTKTESRTIEIGYGVEKWQKTSKFWNRWNSLGILFFIDKEKRIYPFNSIQYFGFQPIFSSYSQTDTFDCVWRISHCNYWSLSIYVSSPTIENGFLIKTLPIFLFMIYD